MNCYSKGRSVLDLAQLFFGFLEPTDSDLGESDDEVGASRMPAIQSGESLGG